MRGRLNFIYLIREKAFANKRGYMPEPGKRKPSLLIYRDIRAEGEQACRSAKEGGAELELRAGL